MNSSSLILLDQTIKKIEGAYAPATIRAYRADFRHFIDFCTLHGVSACPAAPSAVAQYVMELTRSGRGSASIRRALCGLATIHELNGYANCVRHPEVRLAMRRMHRQLGRHAHQALAITRDLLDRMLAATDTSVRGARDRALLVIAYETLCRRSELVTLRIEDVRRRPAETLTGAPITSLLLRKSKTDPEASGRWIHLSPDAAQALEHWLALVGDSMGALFRGVHGTHTITASLGVGQICRIYKRVARVAGLEKAVVAQISGHSPRVGAAQDLALAGESLPRIMIRGRWSKPDTVMRYIERVTLPAF